jgi:hypothetical protein
MEQTIQRGWHQKLWQILGNTAAWAWTIVAGGGGLGLLITLGPLPLTNGWFALFSGFSACPLTAWLLKKYAGITLSGWARFGIALLIIVIGRLVLKIEGAASSSRVRDALGSPSPLPGVLEFFGDSLPEFRCAALRAVLLRASGAKQRARGLH